MVAVTFTLSSERLLRNFSDAEQGVRMGKGVSCRAGLSTRKTLQCDNALFKCRGLSQPHSFCMDNGVLHTCFQENRKANFPFSLIYVFECLMPGSLPVPANLPEFASF